jgi:hypothetical protein
LALNAKNENTRLNAGKYIIDRVLDTEAGAEADPLRDLLAKTVVTQAERELGLAASLMVNGGSQLDSIHDAAIVRPVEAAERDREAVTIANAFAQGNIAK